MLLEFIGGPMDGFEWEFRKPPAAVQFNCFAKFPGRFYAVYEFDPNAAQMIFAATFPDDQGVAIREDVVARPWLEFQGEGRLWNRWITVTELKEQTK